jgi:hypothetical protein
MLARLMGALRVRASRWFDRLNDKFRRWSDEDE